MKKIIGIFLLVIINVFSSGLAGANKVKVVNYGKSDIQKYITNDIMSISYADLSSKDYQDDKIVYKTYYEKILDLIVKFSEKESDEEFINLAKSLISIDDYIDEVLFVLEKNSLAASLEDDFNYDENSQEDGYTLIFRGDNVKIESVLDEYFDYNGEVYIPQDGEADVYIRRDENYYVVSSNLENLDNYLLNVKNGNQNEEFIEKFSMLTKDNYTFSLLNLRSLLNEFENASMYSSFFVEELGYAYGIPKLLGKEIEYRYIVEGKGPIFDLLDSSKLEKRELTTYKPSTGVHFYFANNSFKELFQKINEIYMTFSGQDMLAMVQAFYPPNIDVLNFLDNIGDEALFVLENKDYKKFSFALNSKNKDDVRDVLMHFGAMPEGDKLIMNTNEFYLKDDKVFVNKEFEKTEKILDTDNLFLAVNANLAFLDKNLEKYNYSVYFYNREDGIESKITYDLDNIVELLDALSNDFGGI